MLARHLKKKGIACDVIAPSLTPKGSGDKIKTDRRDARMLARLHRAGELTAVHIPDDRDEAIRDLCRASTDAVQDQRSGRNQLKALIQSPPPAPSPFHCRSRAVPLSQSISRLPPPLGWHLAKAMRGEITSPLDDL